MFEKANWIGVNQDMGDVCPTFQRTFLGDGKIESACLHITAIGVYEACLNGKRVGDFVLAPGCSAYRERLQYQSYDVTGMIGGQNELLVTVGTGWHRGRISKNSTDINTMPCAVIAQLDITYEDGSHKSYVSDEEWKVTESRVVFSDIYDGETYDATRPEKLWEKVKLLPELSKDRLIPQEGEIIAEQERLKPVRCFTTPKGERVIDFGQNFAGYLEISVDAGEGDRIVISHAEVLDAQGNFYTENYRSAQARLTYICKDGHQTYKPSFTFYGFRYIRLDEFPGEAALEQFTGIVIYSKMHRTGNITCGVKGINKLFANTIWSQRANFIDIPTDCPQRDERMGWTGDAQVFAKTAGYNYDVSKFFAKWLRDMRVEQTADGMIPDVVPNFWLMKRGSTAWGDAITVIPWQMYLLYGDKEILEENYSAMRSWVDYMTEDSLDSFLWTSRPEDKKLWGKHYGDWLAQDAPYGSYSGATDVDFIASAFYAYSTELLIKAGKVIGRDVSKYQELHEGIVAAFKERFSCLTTQTEHVLALQFGLTDNREQTAKKLVEMIRQNGNKLETGFVGTPYLLHVLSENGYPEVAYDLLLQEQFPSWLYEVNHGATTIWEHWDGVRDDGTIWSSDMNSYNHYAYGCVMDWIYGVAAGITPDSEHPGFARIMFRPVADARLGWLDVSLETRNGMARSKWTVEEDCIRYEISTPTDALIYIGNQAYSVTKGDYVFYSSR